MAQLNWKHHALIQALLSHGPMQEEEFHAAFSGIFGKDPVSHQQLLNDCLLKINKELTYVQFELRGCTNQYDGKVHYGVVNNASDEQSKLGTKYSVPQIAFYKAVVEAIVHDATNQGCINNIEALNVRLENQVQTGQGSLENQSYIPPAFKSFSISQKEKSLKDLIQNRWLCYTLDGKIGLGVRSFLDLRSWFHVNDIPSCDVCNEAGVKASTCPNEGCNLRMHDYCSKKKFSRPKVARVCPNCNTPWLRLESEEDGEGELEEEAAVPQNHQLAPDDQVPRRGTRRCKAEVVDAGRTETRVEPPPVDAGRAETRVEPPRAELQRKRTRRSKAGDNGVSEIGSSQTVTSPDPRIRRSLRLSAV